MSPRWIREHTAVLKYRTFTAPSSLLPDPRPSPLRRAQVPRGLPRGWHEQYCRPRPQRVSLPTPTEPTYEALRLIGVASSRAVTAPCVFASYACARAEVWRLPPVCGGAERPRERKRPPHAGDAAYAGGGRGVSGTTSARLASRGQMLQRYANGCREEPGLFAVGDGMPCRSPSLRLLLSFTIPRAHVASPRLSSRRKSLPVFRAEAPQSSERLRSSPARCRPQRRRHAMAYLPPMHGL